MTHIVPSKYATKKSFKEAVAKGERIYIVDPSIFSPVNGTVEAVLRAIEQRGETQYVVTNHPKRSWFAQVTRDTKGKVVVK